MKGFPLNEVPSMGSLNWLLLCAVCLVEGMDMNLLPSSFRAMEAELGFSPNSLAIFQALQGAAQALSGIAWANLIDSGHSCKQVVCSGVLGWAVANCILACSESVAMICAFRVFNGLCLGMVLPVVQSQIATHVRPEFMGSYFGLLAASMGLGKIIALAIAAPLAEEVVLGVPGWRAALAITACLSLTIAVAFHLFFHAPSAATPRHKVDLLEECKKFAGYLGKPTFCVVLCQGLVGTIPNAALSFQLLFMQYSGLSDTRVAIAASMCVVGTMFGGPLGGYIGDRLERWSKQHGRPFTGQVSVLLGIPLMYIMFFAPVSPDMFWHFATINFVSGLLAHWAASGCNQPLLARIVPSGSKASVMAWEYSLESLSGQTIGPLSVSLLATHAMKYKTQEMPIADMPSADRIANATALGKGLFISTVFPWMLCAALYSFLHFCDLSAQDGEGETILAKQKTTPKTYAEARL
ncbi:unnamed protein product [Symbiodinium sp. CCMP2456]|nr:unnamed protein product [Symbiodinium sp. CCMP2456]